MRKLSRHMGTLTLVLCVPVLVFLNIQVAQAHNWWSWHWHTGSDVSVWVSSTQSAVHNAALNQWDLHTDVRFPRSTSHTEMSMLAGNYGNTGWRGLAEIKESAFDWWHNWNYSKITHCHATLNTSYSGNGQSCAPGVDCRWLYTQCQEVGHCLGLTHSNDGCMGAGSGGPNFGTVSHNWADVNSKF